MSTGECLNNSSMRWDKLGVCIIRKTWNKSPLLRASLHPGRKSVSLQSHPLEGACGNTAPFSPLAQTLSRLHLWTVLLSCFAKEIIITVIYQQLCSYVLPNLAVELKFVFSECSRMSVSARIFGAGIVIIFNLINFSITHRISPIIRFWLNVDLRDTPKWSTPLEIIHLELKMYALCAHFSLYMTVEFVETVNELIYLIIFLII